MSFEERIVKEYREARRIARNLELQKRLSVPRSTEALLEAMRALGQNEENETNLAENV